MCVYVYICETYKSEKSIVFINFIIKTTIESNKIQIIFIFRKKKVRDQHVNKLL